MICFRSKTGLIFSAQLKETFFHSYSPFSVFVRILQRLAGLFFQVNTANLKKQSIEFLSAVFDSIKQDIIEGVIEGVAEGVTERVLLAIEAKQQQGEHPLMRPSEAAEFMRISEPSVRKLVREGKLEGSYPMSDLRLVRDDVIRYIKERTIKRNSP